METFQKPVTFIYFWSNYCDGNHHIERIPTAVKYIDHLFRLASGKIRADNLHLFLLSDSTRIDDNEYLESLENGTELIVKSRNCRSILNWKGTEALKTSHIR